MYWESDEDYNEWVKDMVKYYEKAVNDYKRLVISHPHVESMKPTLESCEAMLIMFQEDLAKLQRQHKQRYEKMAGAINKGFKVIQGGLCKNT